MDDLLAEETPDKDAGDDLGGLGDDGDDLGHLEDDDDVLEGLEDDDDMADLLADEDTPAETEDDSTNDIYVPPTRGRDHLAASIEDSIVPAHHVASGNFGKALELLKNQIALANPQVLRPLFVEIYSAS